MCRELISVKLSKFVSKESEKTQIDLLKGTSESVFAFAKLLIVIKRARVSGKSEAISMLILISVSEE